MAASSSGSWRYDVFPSFSGEDVRKTFLSHLLKELDRRSIKTFIDNGIVRSRPIAPELISAIREARISIVIFSKNYASSTWCLNELEEIHERYKKFDQMVIPVFYDVDPSEVRKQTGEFGKVFKETCKNKTDDQKQRWTQALADVADLAGEHLQKKDEASMIEKIANDVSNKLVTTSNDFGDFVGIEAHLEALRSMLCLESKEAKMMVGIVGTSGIGKSTIGRALYSQLSSQFPHHAFGTYKSTNKDVIGMKLSWEKQFLSEILGQKDIKIDHVGEVKQRLNHKKVLIVLDDVDDLELLKTLVGKTEWFGPGSRIIVITQDRRLLKAHKIDLIYEVEYPSEALALKMLCRSAFEQDSPPDGFMELAVEVAKLAGNLPLGLSVLGSSLKERDKDEWTKMPGLRNHLDGNIKKTLRVSYDRLNKTDRELFLWIACFFNGYRVSDVGCLLDKVGLEMLTDKSLIRITPKKTIEMHSLLVKLGREIDREESNGNLGKRRFLVDYEDIREVFTHKTGTETVLGIRHYTYLRSKNKLSIDEKSFEGMRNLQYLQVMTEMDLPQSLDYLPRKLRLLHWDYCPLKCLPSNFKAEYLVELKMAWSKLEKLWEGTQPLGSLKKMDMNDSLFLKEIPDLSKAINLEELNLSGCDNLREIPDLSKATNLEDLNLNRCKSLVTVPSTIGNLHKLVMLEIQGCTGLEVLPTDVHLSSLKILDLRGCSSLRSFPQISWSIERLNLEYTAIEEVPCCIKYFSRLTILTMFCCERLKNISPNIFRLTRLRRADFSGSGRRADFSGSGPVITTLIEYKYEFEVFNFENCFILDRDARELIIRSCFKLMVLPGREVPMYFKHRAYGDSLTVILPQSFISQKLLRFKVCVVVDLLTKVQGCRSYVDVSVRFNGIEYFDTLFEDGRKWKTDHLILCSFKFQPTDVISKLASNDVKFEFFSLKKIKECGVQLLKIKDDSGGSSETEPPKDSDGSKKQMRMTSGTSEEYIVADTGLDALNLEVSLGQGEASSVSSYPCLEGKAFSIITEQQDEVIPILYPCDEPGN